jgi:hypothetical protein
MKVKPNRLPKAFHNASGLIELPLAKFVRKEPSVRITIQNMVRSQMGDDAAGAIDFEDEKSLIRILVDKGTPVCCEIGYPEDEWQLQKKEKADGQ